MADFNRKDPINDRDAQEALLAIQNIIKQLAHSTEVLFQGYQQQVSKVIDQYNKSNFELKHKEQPTNTPKFGK